MNLAISNLPFMGFRDAELIELIGKHNYNLEIFCEFGTNDYWKQLLRNIDRTAVKLSVHAPCVSVNLADRDDRHWFKIYKETILFAQQYQADFVVVHTNEGWQGDKYRTQQLVEERLLQVVTFAQSNRVELLIENVGLISKNNLLYDFKEYCNLLDKFPSCGVLIDTGHAHANRWNLPETLAALGNRIRAMHLHDNDGNADLHQCIGTGTINWTDCFAAVKLHTPQAALILEYSQLPPNGLVKHIEILKGEYGL